MLRESLVDGDGSKYFATLINDRQAGPRPLSNACVRALNSYISISSENTRAGVITSFRSRLELWQNPLVDAATSENDFDLRSLRKERMSIYLGVTPDNLERMAPLINLFFQQALDLNTRELPNQNKQIKYKCLLLMDEFTAIGKIPALSKGISFIAGYWLRMLPIIQSPAQLVEVYGKEAAQTFQTNHALQIIFPPKASETQNAKDISEWLGYQTVKGTSESRAKGIFKKKQNSENISDQRRALMLPQEITSLGRDKEIVIMEDVPPIIAKKVRYFEDREFTDRLKRVSTSLNNISGIPSQAALEKAITAGELAAKVPTLDVHGHSEKYDANKTPLKVEMPVVGGKKIITETRPIEVADLDNLQNLKFDIQDKLDAVEGPKDAGGDEKRYTADLLAMLCKNMVQLESPKIVLTEQALES